MLYARCMLRAEVRCECARARVREGEEKRERERVRVCVRVHRPPLRFPSHQNGAVFSNALPERAFA